jgi:hypothetical protein
MADEDWYELLQDHVSDYWYFFKRGDSVNADRVKRLLEEYLCWQDESGQWNLPNFD